MVALLVLASPAPAARAAAAADPTSGPTIIPSIKNDVSRPLIEQGDEQGQHTGDHQNREIPHRAIPGHDHQDSSSAPQPGTPAVVPAVAPTLLSSFEGIGNGFSGPNGTFSVNSAPPDTNGAVGPNHYVETVNTSFAVFNKSGTPVYGPVPINQVWSGFGGGCQTNNDGDPTVVYDGIADRWVISQFSVTTTPYLMCVAVSATSDPTGSYNRYSFSYGSVNFPDYPKLSVWPDAYYLTVNFFANGVTFAGAGVAALDRASMLAGLPATQQLFQTSTSYGGLLASTLDGSTQPPAGSPNYVVALGTSSSLVSWKFHVDWAGGGKSTTFTGPTTISVPAYAEACNGGTCVPQPTTTQPLDSLADRLMYRLAYRNFGDHESLVANHSITAGSSVGVRWYELRIASGNPTLYQSGTYAPDASYRWMGSIAMDKAGGIGLGFSVSSSTVRPGIHYTGRLAGDAQGTMTQGEGTIFDGAGSQTGSNLSRWGDYTAMTVDPVDGCTFWYTNEYIPTNGAFNWGTRIGSFKLPSCGVTNDFSISANPTSVSALQSSTATSTISTAVTTGVAESVALSASGLPSGTTASFNPASVTAGGSSTLTLTVGATTPGTYPITVTGTTASATHTATVNLTVTAPNDFSISANPTSVSVAQGGTGTSTISTAITSGNAESIALSTSGLPSGTTTSFNPASVTAGGSSTLTFTVGAGTTPGTYPVTVTGTATSATHTTTVNLTVTVPNDFSITASPTSVSATQGTSTTSTISTALTSGVAETVSLSSSGVPSGSTASFNPASVAAGGTSTLTLAAGAATTPGTYTVTVTGTAPSASHSTTVSLTVIVRNDFSISASPSSVSTLQNTTATSTISTTVSSGNAESIGFSTSGLPTGTTAAFNPASVNAGGSSTLTFTVGATTPGTYPITVTGTAASATHTTTVSLTVTAPNDFSISANPTSVSVAQGGTGTSTISTAITSGNAESIALSTSGLPSGTTAAFNPASVNAGGSSTLTFTVGAGTTPGTYPVTVTGTATSNSHSTSVSVTVTVPPPSGITNGGFESGFTGWTQTGSTAISSTAHGGVASAMVGSSSPFNGDSSVAQTFTAPAGGGTLSFFYRVVCTDTVTYDWATAALRDNTAATTTTMLARTCTNTGAWNSASAVLTGSHSYTLTLIDHDDNYASDPTYTLYDDVSIGSAPPPPPSGIRNGGFENGLSGWTTSGTVATSTTAHTGTAAARVGSTSPFNGDSSIAQTFSAPATGGTLTFWYRVVCTDTVTYDWATATLRDNTAGATTTVLAKTCTNTGTWSSRTASLVASHSYTLTLIDHDDNYPSDPTYTLYDDVTIQ